MHEIKIYFDYTCPYCLIANANVRRFQTRYSEVSFSWKPWEILPEAPAEGLHLEFDSVSPRLAKLAEEAGMWLRAPSIQPNSHLALLGLFYAREKQKFQEYHNAVFDALWNNDENIGQPATLTRIVDKTGLDPLDFKSVIADHKGKYEQMLAGSERDAEIDSIKLAPTFMFGEKQIVGNVSARRIEKFIARAGALRVTRRPR
ncbi:MAG: DsbA family protein [Promethearchaeati archaeon SRVP18_Atabeyarchaeia-1]